MDDIEFTTRKPEPHRDPESMLCWCCQADIFRTEMVRLSKTSDPIPCCASCWDRIPESQRMQLGIAIERTREMKAGDTLSVVRRLIEVCLMDRDDMKWPLRN